MNLEPPQVADKPEGKPPESAWRGAPDGRVTDDGERRPGCQGDGGCEVSDADVTSKTRKEQRTKCRVLSAALGGEAAGQNRGDVGLTAAQRPSSRGKDGGKTPGCRFALDPPPV